MCSHHTPAQGGKGWLAFDTEKQLPQYFRPHILGKGLGSPLRGGTRLNPTPPSSTHRPGFILDSPNSVQAPPRPPCPAPGPPRRHSRRPAGALELRGSARGGAAGLGGGAAGRGGLGRAEGAPGRKEAAGGRAGGRSGPGAAGPERRRRHVRQREAQPGLYHRAPAGRLAGAGEVGARRALAPCLARKWCAGGPAPPRASLDWAGTGLEVPRPQPPPQAPGAWEVLGTLWHGEQPPLLGLGRTGWPVLLGVREKPKKPSSTPPRGPALWGGVSGGRPPAHSSSPLEGSHPGRLSSNS